VHELHHALCATVQAARPDEQLSLIRAHPDLVTRSLLTIESQGEQASAGLHNISPEEARQFQEYNAQYRERFGFPFVICARLNKKEAILRVFPKRLQHLQEIETALRKSQNRHLRLQDLIDEWFNNYVLDTMNGRPAAGMKIELWSLGHLLKAVTTTRTAAQIPSPRPEEFAPAVTIVFCGRLFRRAAFLDRVPVRFTSRGAKYHVPLLVSPWAYSTMQKQNASRKVAADAR
jgi:2-oxo-4-hydroxy-4-carboxy-5-ureidoimidazoline decarboxylase